MSLSSRNQRLKRPIRIPYLLQGTYEAFKQYNDSMIDRRRAVRVAVDRKCILLPLSVTASNFNNREFRAQSSI